jgi:hypothetical protein
VFETNNIQENSDIFEEFYGELIITIHNFCQDVNFDIIDKIFKMYNGLREAFGYVVYDDVISPIDVANFFYFVVNTDFWKNHPLATQSNLKYDEYANHNQPLESSTADAIKVMKCLSRVASDFLCLFRPMTLESFTRLALSIYNNASSHVVFDDQRLDQLFENTNPCVCCAYELNTEQSDACVSIMSQYPFGVKRGLHVPSKRVAYQILKQGVNDNRWLSNAYRDEKRFKWLRLLLARDVRIADESIEYLDQNESSQKLYLLDKVFIQFSEKLNDRLDMDSLVRQGSNSIPFMLQYFYGDGYTDEQLRLFANCASILPHFDSNDEFMERVRIDQIGNQVLTVFGDDAQNATEVLRSFPDDQTLDEDIDNLLRKGNEYSMFHCDHFYLLLPSEVDHIPDEGRETLHALTAYCIDDPLSVYNYGHDHTQFTSTDKGSLWVGRMQHQSMDAGISSYRNSDMLFYIGAILEKSVTAKVLECFKNCLVKKPQPPMNLKYAIVQFRTDHAFVNFPYSSFSDDKAQMYGYYKNLRLVLDMLFVKTSKYEQDNAYIVTDSNASFQWIRLKSPCNVAGVEYESNECVLYELSYFPMMHITTLYDQNIDEDMFGILFREGLDAIVSKYEMGEYMREIYSELTQCTGPSMLDALNTHITKLDSVLQELAISADMTYVIHPDVETYPDTDVESFAQTYSDSGSGSDTDSDSGSDTSTISVRSAKF